MRFGYVGKLVSRKLYASCHNLLKYHEGDVESNETLISSVVSLRSGWHMIECQVKEACTLTFFFSGAEEEATFALSIRNQRIAKRIVFLPGKISFLQILSDRLVNSGHIQYLRFVPLHRSFAMAVMLKRLQANKTEMQQLARRNQRSFEVFLFGAYDNLFSTDQDKQYQQWIMQVEPGQLHTYETKKCAQTQLDKSEYLCFCAPGYQMIPEAEKLMMSALHVQPDAKLVYADEDTIDCTGRRSNPCFKPDWNPDLFMGHDYLSSFYICRRHWYMANQDLFDLHGERLVLSRLLPLMGKDEILHIPLVLAHSIKTQQHKGEPFHADRAALLKKVLPESSVVHKGLLPGTFRIKYALPRLLPLVSLLIPSRDHLSVLAPCVESILNKTDYPEFEIIILDNQSEQPDTLKWFAEIQEDTRVKVICYDLPFNYSAINNFGVQHAKGSVIGLINNDVEVISPEWLSEMVSHALRPEVGCVGAKLYYGNGQIQHGGVVLGLGDVAGHAHRYLQHDEDGYQGRLKLVQNYSAVTAACLLVRRNVYEQVGGLDEEHLTVAYNDVDFCLRVREAGYHNLWTPYAELYHHESISRGKDNTQVKKKRYAKEVAYMRSTWKKALVNDPCYNVNLSRKREDFSLREF